MSSNLNEKEMFQMIGKNVKYYRLRYSLMKDKMTQERLAELVGVSTALIGNLESEKVIQGIGVYTLLKISNSLQVPIEDFFATPIKER
jgi:transcriptional regulator with XRE-family HTH domain